MSEKTGPKPAKTEASFDLSLDEFCRRLSATDDRVEMIGGFHVHMRSRNKVSGSEQMFMGEFEKFQKRKV